MLFWFILLFVVLDFKYYRVLILLSISLFLVVLCRRRMDERSSPRAWTNVRSTRNRKSIGPSLSTLKVSLSHSTRNFFSFIVCRRHFSVSRARDIGLLNHWLCTCVFEWIKYQLNNSALFFLSLLGWMWEGGGWCGVHMLKNGTTCLESRNTIIRDEEGSGRWLCDACKKKKTTTNGDGVSCVVFPLQHPSCCRRTRTRNRFTLKSWFLSFKLLYISSVDSSRRCVFFCFVFLYCSIFIPCRKNRRCIYF